MRRLTPAFCLLAACLMATACDRSSSEPAAPSSPPAAEPAPEEAAAETEPEAAEPEAPAAPTGDSCADAMPVTLAANAYASANGTVTGKTFTMSASSRGDFMGPDMIFRIDVDNQDVIHAGLHTGGAFDGALQLFHDCDDPEGSNIGTQVSETVVIPIETQAEQAGALYIAVLSETGTTEGDFTLVLERRPNNPGPPPAAGDSCANATTLTLPLQAYAPVRDNTNTFGGDIAPTGRAWPGPDHFWAFEGQAGQRLHLNIEPEIGVASGWFLFRSCDDIPGTTLAGAIAESSDDMTIIELPEAGRYILGIGNDEGAQGGYSILLF